MPTNHSLLEFNLQLKYFSIMLVGVVDMTTTIKVGEWGKKYWGKSKCHETNIRDIEPFFKKMVIISILWLIFWILKRKGFFAAFVCMPFTFMGDVYMSYIMLV